MRIRQRLWGAVAAIGAVVALATPGAVARPAAPADEGFQFVEHAIFRLDPAGTAVHVEVVTDITNQSPSRTSGGYIRSAYLPRYGLPLLAEAINVAATTADGTPLDVSIEPADNPRFAFAVADITDLFYPDSTTVRITYDLPSLPPRSEGLSRINPAYAVFPVQTFGDPGLCDVEVIVPKGFEVEMSDTQLTKEERGEETAYVARAIGDPGEFFTIISARNDAALVERKIETEPVDVTVQSWPGDEAWGDFVADKLQRGIPLLEELIGEPWASGDELEIIETSNPYIYGYSGWYLPSKSLIEVGDEFKAVVIMHELSHVWFNHDLFAGRWINEAFAEEYAREAALRLGETPEPLQPIDLADPGAVRLNAWGTPALDEAISDAREPWGYNASVAVLNQIRAEIGFEGLARVLDAAFEGLIAYQGDLPAESDSRTTSWKRLLDLLDEIGGSTVADGLFATYVVDPTQEPLFAARAASRAGYVALKQRGAEWSPPVAVRREMSDWSFPTADTFVATSNAILDTRDQMVALLAPLAVPAPQGLEDAYERARLPGELADVAKQALDLLAAAQELAAADAALRQSSGPVDAIGAWFANPEGKLRDAKLAFDVGDAALAGKLARDAANTAEDGPANAAKGLAATLVAAGAAFGIGRRARRELNLRNSGSISGL